MREHARALAACPLAPGVSASLVPRASVGGGKRWCASMGHRCPVASSAGSCVAGTCRAPGVFGAFRSYPAGCACCPCGSIRVARGCEQVRCRAGDRDAHGRGYLPVCHRQSATGLLTRALSYPWSQCHVTAALSVGPLPQRLPLVLLQHDALWRGREPAGFGRRCARGSAAGSEAKECNCVILGTSILKCPRGLSPSFPHL